MSPQTRKHSINQWQNQRDMEAPPDQLAYSFLLHHSIFFQNEVIFVQFDELDELDRITHAS